MSLGSYSSQIVTLRDIAEKADASVQAVARALSGETKGFRKDAAARAAHIREVARSLGYRRNIGAAAMRSRQFGSIAMVLSADNAARSNLPQAMLAAITDALDDRDMHLSLARLTDEALRDDSRLPRLLRDFGADGLLVNYNKWVPPELEQIIAEHSLPAIWLNDRRPSDAVYPDDRDAGKHAAKHLLSLCHRRIVYYGHPPSSEQPHYSEADRLAGYTEAMREAGLSPEFLHSHAALLERLQSPEPPTAVICYNARIAVTLLLAAASARFTCPADVSLVTFGSGELAYAQTITMLEVPNAEVGRLGVEMLLQKITQGAGPLPGRAVPFMVVQGQTSVPCRQK